MTFGNAKLLLTGLMVGDNQDAITTLETNPAVYLEQGINEVSRRTEPTPLIANYTGTETDIFRRIYYSTPDEFETFTKRYLKTPDLSTLTDETELPVDEELSMAVVYFLANFFSKKRKRDYISEAERVINRFDQNAIDPNTYEELYGDS